MSKKIIFKINGNGNVSIDKVEGYGSSCLDATKFIETALGRANESSRVLTHEYEEAQEQEHTMRVNN
jgi:hypothetical protein